MGQLSHEGFSSISNIMVCALSVLRGCGCAPTRNKSHPFFIRDRPLLNWAIPTHEGGDVCNFEEDMKYIENMERCGSENIS